MTRRIKVTSKQEAWETVNNIFPTDYNEDMSSTARAGYPVYRSPLNHYDYICDLGDRLEVNLGNGETVNVWIVEKAEDELLKLPTEEEVKKAASHQYTFEPETVQLVRVIVNGYSFSDEASKAVYKVMQDKHWESQVAGDMVTAYCEDKGIEWGVIQVIGIEHYQNGKNGGHFVIEAIVSPRIEEGGENN